MTTTIHLTAKSSNAKTGPIPVSTSSDNTCPPTCPFKGSGCYADSGPLKLHWRKTSSGERGDSVAAFCERIAALPEGTFWRHNQAGDLAGDGVQIDADAFGKLVHANKGRKGFTYTHYQVLGGEFTINRTMVEWANQLGFTVNLSGNNLTHADELADTGLPTVTVLPIDAPKVTHTPKGRKVVTCPAVNSDKITCATCRLCQVAERDYIIGFPAHGTSKAKASAIAAQ